MRYKFYALILTLSLVIGIFPITGYAVSYTSDTAPVTLEITSSTLGNNFTNNDKQFTYTFENNTGTDETVKISRTVTDQKGNEIITENVDTYTVPANGSKEITYTPGVSKNGLYTLVTNVTMKSGYYEDKIDFSIMPDMQGNMNPYFGVAYKMSYYPDLGEEVLDLIKKAGLVGFRHAPVTWHTVEKTKGEYTYSQHAEECWTWAQERGFSNCSAILGHSNPIYNGVVGAHNYLYPDMSDETLAAYGEYCKWMAKEYGDKITYYETWNEFNSWAKDDYASVEEMTKDYVKFLKVSCESVKSVDPDAKIVSMCTSMSDIEFIRGALEAGAYKYSDIIAIHPYVWGDYVKETHLKEVGAINELIREYTPDGEEPQPVWFTEIGWPTNTTGIYGHDEDKQAEYLVKMTFDTIANDIAERIYWYDFISDGADMTEKENNFGILRHTKANVPLSAKKSYIAATAMNYFMWDSVYKDQMQYDEDITIYRFDKADGTQFLTLWADGRDTSVKLDLGADRVTCYDMLGNITDTLTSVDGKYNIDVGNDPIYVVGRFEKFDKFTGSLFDADLSFTGNLEVTDKKKASYTVSASNKSSDRVYADLSVTAVNGTYSQSTTEQVLLLPNGMVEKEISLPQLAPGKYDVSIKLSCGTFEKAQQTTLTVTKTMSTTHSVVCENGLVTISGVTENAGDTVGVVIKSDDGISYIEQLQSATDKSWKTQAKLPGNDLYYVFVYDGGVNAQTAQNGISLTTKIMKDNVEIEDITTLKEGDKVNLHITVHDNGTIGDTPGDMYCIISTENLILNVAIAELITGSEMIVPIEIKTPEKIKGFNILLWDKAMRPFTDKFNLTKGN